MADVGRRQEEMLQWWLRTRLGLRIITKRRKKAFCKLRALDDLVIKTSTYLTKVSIAVVLFMC